MQAALETALARGITHFDTATDYGGGDSERRLGQFLKAQPGRREQVFLASKVNLDEVSAGAVIQAIEASLRAASDRLDRPLLPALAPDRSGPAPLDGGP